MNRERGRVVTNFAYLEDLISTFIACSYFKEDELVQLNALKDEILEDKFFSFEFKKQLLEKILKNRFQNKYKVSYRKIEQMQTIRNTVAHGLLVATGDKHDKSKVYNVSLKHGGKVYPARELFDNYEKLRQQVEPVLRQLPGLTVEDYK